MNSSDTPTGSDLPPPDGGAPQDLALYPPSVGSAHRLADGTLHLELRTELPDGTIGEALMVVPPEDPRHAGILAHLGGLAPGQSGPIPPFTLEDDDDED